MIKNIAPLSMTESLEYIGSEEDSEAEARKFVKKFVKMKPAKAKEIREKLGELDLIKMKPENIAKIIDIMPENAEGLNKIFTDVSLNDDETKKILDIVKEYK